MAFQSVVLVLGACTAASSELTSKLVIGNAIGLRGGGPTLPNAPTGSTLIVSGKLKSKSSNLEKSRLPDIALGSNGIVALGYGLAMVLATNKLLATYGVDAHDFISPTVGAFQYLGGLYLMIALRAYAALIAKTRDPKQTLEAFIYSNGTLMAIALYRAYMGSAASKKNVAMFAVLTVLSYYGWATA